MKTEQHIKEIAENLRSLIKSDNDAKRFIDEHLSEFGIVSKETIHLREKLEEKDVEIQDLEEKISNLEGKIQNAIAELD